MPLERAPAPRSSVLSTETSSIQADIRSDPEARALEFGRHSVLALPLQTAVKTGTSNDYRDACVVGFYHRYTVGVWMGNLDRKPMREVTGSIGPALVLRVLFAELHRTGESKPLYLSRKLRQAPICRESGKLPRPSYPLAPEWFRPETVPEDACPLHLEGGSRAGARAGSRALRIHKPSPGLHIALDPRIPDELERFAFELEGLSPGSRVEWWVDDELHSESTAAKGTSLWQPVRGRHRVRARVFFSEASEERWTEPVGFLVK